MGGYSGGPTYIRNKLLYLRKKGWSVLVFDSTGRANLKIKLETLIEFKNNRYKELFYYPQLLRKSKREHIISEIIDKIGKGGDVVIESNTPALSVWGEMIAQRLGAKHIIYLLSEKLSIKEKLLYDYFRYKADRSELFSINRNAYKKLICNYETATNVDNHYWAAGIIVPIEDVDCVELSSVINAKYNIGHFGRHKGYFKYMFQNVACFAQQHKDESINFILLGLDSLSKELQDILPNNVHLKMIPSQQPIPKRFFDMTDVVIATAGCANISFRHGAKVIAMDVENNVPLGVLGYDTRDRNIRSENNPYCLSLFETLENVLVKKRCEGSPVLDFPKSNNGYDYQLKFATLSDGRYYDVDKVFTHQRRVISFLLKLNLISFCSALRYKNNN